MVDDRVPSPRHAWLQVEPGRVGLCIGGRASVWRMRAVPCFCVHLHAQSLKQAASVRAPQRTIVRRLAHARAQRAMPLLLLHVAVLCAGIGGGAWTAAALMSACRRVPTAAVPCGCVVRSW